MTFRCSKLAAVPVGFMLAGLAMFAADGMGRPESPLALTADLLDVNGVKLLVRSGGSGEAMVIVHGGPGLGSDYLVPHFARLAGEYRLVFYDQRGCGGSAGDDQPANLTMDTFVADLEALRERLGIARMILVGQSFGAPVAINYAALHPARVAALLLLEPAPGSAEYLAPFQKTIQDRLSDAEKAELAAVVQSEGFAQREPEAFVKFMTIRFGTYYRDKAAMKRHNLAYFTAEKVRKFFVSSQAFGPYMQSFDIHGLLPKITCPTLILRGDYDPIPAESAERLHEGIAGSTLVVFPDCGHFAHIEAEEAYFSAIRGFLAKRGAGTS